MALRRLKHQKIYSDVLKNSQGEPLEIPLSDSEKYHAAYTQKLVNERFGNAIGYEVPITTLTQIVKRVSEMKLYQVAPADYCPIKVGEGTWSSNLTTYRSFDIADVFESGIINTGGNNTRQSIGDAGVDALNIKVNNWVKNCGWSIFDLEQAARSGNWDVVTAKEKTRKRNWDLGIQRVAFLGAQGQNGVNGQCLGLFNQAGVFQDTTLIPSPLNGFSYTQIAIFQQNVIQRYRANCSYTAYPTHFIIPESDYNGLVTQANPEFPMKSMLELLLEGFKVICQNPNFKILPSSYAQAANANGALPGAFLTQMYTLLNYDEESVRMDVPLDYTNTLANSIDNFMYQNAGYGQFTGVLAYRPAEMYYMGF